MNRLQRNVRVQVVSPPLYSGKTSQVDNIKSINRMVFLDKWGPSQVDDVDRVRH